jgi:hypothetical protein
MPAMLHQLLCLTLDRLECEPIRTGTLARNPLGPIILNTEQNLKLNLPTRVVHLLRNTAIRGSSGVRPALHDRSSAVTELDSDQEWI